MPNVNLNDAEWQQVMSILGDVPWKIAHPLLMRIGSQLQQTAQQDNPPASNVAGAGGLRPNYGGIKLDANGKEIRDE